MLLLLASTAMVGSFCLFCENGDAGLMLVTFTEPSPLAWAASGPLTITKAAADPSTSSTFKGLLMRLFPSTVRAYVSRGSRETGITGAGGRAPGQARRPRVANPLSAHRPL